jgi:penicillin-binding protein 1A
MANAYATLASGGMKNKPIAIKRVVFPDGDVVDLGKPKRERVLSDAVAYEVTKILKQNVQMGTGTRANIGCPAGGKTGTTDNFNDAWFVGFTPYFATSAWVGYPNALREMRSVHGISVAGGTFPAEIWNKFMEVAKGKNCGDFPQPKTSITWTPFFGKYSTSRGGAFSPSYDSGRAGRKKRRGETSGGGYGGYDPRIYEAPPQQPSGPPTAGKPAKPHGGGHGKSRGQGTGGARH